MGDGTVDDGDVVRGTGTRVTARLAVTDGWVWVSNDSGDGCAWDGYTGDGMAGGGGRVEK